MSGERQTKGTVRALERVPVLTADACAAVVDKVHAIKDLWVRRADAPFYSLGAASYLDGLASDELYYALAEQFNPILRENFAGLYGRLAEALSAHLSAPTHYVPRFALPGFHIFQDNPAFAEAAGCVHCDLQYQKLDWKDCTSPDFSDPLSFTLALALPQQGGGLRLWNVEHREVVGRTFDEMRVIFRSRECRYEAYTVGEMVVHSGHSVHQIAPMPGMACGSERITLQGHGVFAGGVWNLYW